MGWYGHLREKREKGVRPVRTFKGEGKEGSAQGKRRGEKRGGWYGHLREKREKGVRPAAEKRG